MTMPSDRRRAGIEQMVEREARKGLADLRPADDLATCSVGNRPAEKLRQKIRVRGVSSDGFSITRLPAASAATSGTIARLNG